MNVVVDEVAAGGVDPFVVGATTSMDSSAVSDRTSDFKSVAAEGDNDLEFLRDVGEKDCRRDSMSIFSSFSSRRSFNSRTSDSSCRTRSSSDSVYPRGKALRLSLSLVLHSKPTLEHWVQHGRTPSHLIFLLLHLSQACAIRL